MSHEFDFLLLSNLQWATWNYVFSTFKTHVHIYTFHVCLGVCLWPINVKTAKPIGPKFFVGPHMTPEKVYGCSELQRVASKNLKKLFYSILREFLSCIFTHNLMILGIKSFLFIPRQISNILYRQSRFPFLFADFNKFIWEILFFVVIFTFLFVFGFNSRF